MANIFDPIKIGKIEIKNRTMYAPTMTTLANLDGSVNDQLIAYYRNIAESDIGVIVVEHSYVDEIASRGYRHMLGNYRAGLGLEKLAKEIKRYCTCILQINHTGPKANPSLTKGLPRGPVSERNFDFFRGPQGEMQGATVEELQEIVKAFGMAAARAEEAGFDGVEVNACHHNLISVFISPKYNTRKDRYGGNLEGRLTLALEVLSSIKKNVSKDFVIGYRINGAELMEQGLPIEEGIKVGQILEKAGVHYLSIGQCGTPLQGAALTTTYDKLGELTYIPGSIMGKVSIPVAGVGGLHSPGVIKRALEENKMDIVAICRGLIADPQITKKIKERREAEQRLCIRCNFCIDTTWHGAGIKCTVNPMVGKETSWDYDPVPVAQEKKVIVIGGGVAGMEAARVASKKGHAVTLYEMSNHLGGQVSTASIIKELDVFKTLVKYYETTLKLQNVDLRLNHKISVEEINKLQPDVVILAIGAEDRVPDIPGGKQTNVVTGTQVLLGDKQVKGEVAVIGGSVIGCQLALHLAENKCSVKLIDRRKKSNFASGLMCDNVKLATLDRIAKKNIKIYDEMEVFEIKEKMLSLKNNKGGKEEIKIDYVVFCDGLTSKKEIVPEMIDKSITVFKAGDCVRPRNIYSAIHEGADVAFKIGAMV